VDLTNNTAPTKVLDLFAIEGTKEWQDMVQLIAFNGSSDQAFFTAYRNRTVYKWDTNQPSATIVNDCYRTQTCVGAREGGLLSTTIFGPYGLAFNSAGDMFVSEAAGSRIWMASAGTGRLKLVAGLHNPSNYSTIIDPSNPTNNTFSFLQGLDLGPGEGSVFFSDFNNHRIVRVLLNCTME
jgi:hypothetical protein